mmetsp:Transcript_19152/g.31398  ORF Transcript_19152/g.31398 Transcript_19152/m.31398 type:complete len:390 (+) Transcript_19152:68-1237(+)
MQKLCRWFHKCFLLFALAALNFALVNGCRWAIYASSDQDIHAAAFLVSSSHSLLKQTSGKPFLPGVCDGLYYDLDKLYIRNHETNQDGWGVGWIDDEGFLSRERSAYGAAVDDVPHPDYLNCANNVSSKMIFAHIRAATDTATTPENAHPFVYNKVLWQHNGGVPNRNALDALLIERGVDLNSTVVGDTDSEHVGALFGHYLKDHELSQDVCVRDDFKKQELIDAMLYTLRDLKGISDETCAHSSLNLAASDGETVIVTRYRTDPEEDPPSLYFSLGEHWNADKERMETLSNDGGRSHVMVGKSLVVSSEPLGRSGTGWISLCKDEMLIYDRKQSKVEFLCLTESCRKDYTHRCNVMSKKGAVYSRDCTDPPPLAGIITSWIPEGKNEL